MSVPSFDLTPNLELEVAGKTYSVPPPNRQTGLVLQALLAVQASLGTSLTGACPTCHRSDPLEVDPKFEELVEKYKHRDLGELSLGRRVMAQLNKDGVDGATMDRVGMYAFYYWTLGEMAANQTIFGGADSGEALPKGRKA